jgi:hypothetical protein
MVLEPLEPFGQLGQAAKPGELLLEFIEWPCGCAPDDLAASHNFAGRDSCLRPNHRVVFDLAVIGNPDLTADGYILSNYARARNPRLRGYYCIFPDAYVMRDVDEVVQFRASPDFRAIQGSAINCGIRADFHILVNFHLADLWKFPAFPVLGDVAEAVGADHSAGMQDYAVAEPGAGI